VKIWRFVFVKVDEKRTFAVMSHILPKKLESLGYIFVADTMCLASVSLTRSKVIQGHHFR